MLAICRLLVIVCMWNLFCDMCVCLCVLYMICTVYDARLWDACGAQCGWDVLFLGYIYVALFDLLLNCMYNTMFGLCFIWVYYFMMYDLM